ncbi:tetratricopeptide repeat-containing sensor histidine kinase [uncultured Pontibacter sp.]|uniref:tetratricopeptide repeat-containing sensor histidine kinase n=1 Tax=uncultured Pontibacter sp. TaxID=453356 RepID=UPI0026143A32|nr:tetratricopeptide repeat-containing sensor histidine kinase [uncultured Pontibacter sp.]
MRLILAFFLVVGASFVQAHPTNTDSLLHRLKASANDTVAVGMHAQLAAAFYYTDVKRGTQHATAALDLAKKLNYKAGSAKAFLLLSHGNLILGEYDRGISRTYSALKLGEQLNDTTILFSAHNRLGIMYAKLNNTAKAKHHYMIAMELAIKTGNKHGLGKVYNNIGNLYEANGDFTEALKLFKKAAALQESLGELQSQAISLHNIGNIYLQLPDPNEGLPYLHQSIEINKAIGNKMLPSTSLGSIGRIMMAAGDTAAALNYGKESYQTSLITGSSKTISAAAKLLQEIYAAVGDYKQAYRYLVILAEHEAALDLESQQKSAADITAKYEAEARELAMQQLTADSEKQAILIEYQRDTLLLSSLIILLLIVSFVMLYLAKKRLGAAHSKLSETNAQIQQQHFKILSQKDEIAVQAQRLKEQNDVLEEHSAFKNKIFSMISHDLRAPFNSLKGILRLMSNPHLTESDYKHMFALLEKDMGTASNMLHNLLVWAKSQLETATLSLEDLDLNTFTDTVILETQGQANEKGILIYNEVPHGFTGRADKERLGFVIRNILSNAIKFSAPGSEVHVRARNQGNNVLLTIQDQGKGISRDHLQKLFKHNRFTTLGTHKERGTGLGLVFSKELLESMNGSITVESQEQVGSVFSIILPKEEIKAYPATSENQAAPALATHGAF